MLSLIIFAANAAFCSEPDYGQIYMDMQVPNFSYVHGIDPGQYYDNKNAAYSIYPLFKLCSPLYFKTIAILPGYYELTPRNHKGSDYLLFKDCGAVKYIVPIYKKELVPEGFYETHIPKRKLKFTQQISIGFSNFLGKYVARSQRKPLVQTYLEVNDLDNNLVALVVYYGNYRYYAILRTVQL